MAVSSTPKISVRRSASCFKLLSISKPAGKKRNSCLKRYNRSQTRSSLFQRSLNCLVPNGRGLLFLERDGSRRLVSSSQCSCLHVYRKASMCQREMYPHNQHTRDITQKATFKMALISGAWGGMRAVQSSQNSSSGWVLQTQADLGRRPHHRSAFHGWIDHAAPTIEDPGDQFACALAFYWQESSPQ